MVKRAKLKDENLEKEMIENGFVIYPSFLNGEEVKEIFELFQNTPKVINKDNSFWNSFWHTSPQIKYEISNAILSIVNNKLGDIFENWESPIASIMSKNPGEHTLCEAHRDFSILDEDKYQYRNCWIPLVDINKNNGQLFVFKGSHKVFHDVLPMQNKWPYEEHLPELMKYAQYVDSKAGDLVIYGDKTLHGSLANLSDHPRPVVHFGALHEDYELAYFDRNDEQVNDEVKMYAVPKDFYFEHDFNERAKKYPLLKKFHLDRPKLTSAEFTALCEKMQL